MNVAGMGSLYAEGMTFSSDDFAKKAEQYAAMLASQGGYQES